MLEYFFKKDFLGKRLSLNGKAVPGIALFLDFDGTLVPIRRDPTLCFPSAEVKKQLCTLAECGHVYLSIVSGRTVRDVKKRIALPGINYAGNHGLAIAGPQIRFIHPAAKVRQAGVTHAYLWLKKALCNFEGIRLEDKEYTVTLHYRNVRREDRTKIARTFYAIVSEIAKYSPVGVLRGKKVLELTPAIGWNKGAAVRMILEHVGENWLPVVIGDDVTDESAFEAVNKKGVTIRIGRSRSTAAQFYLKGQSEVAEVLKRITDCF